MTTMSNDIQLHAMVMGVWERMDYARSLLFQLANQGWQVPLYLDSQRNGPLNSYMECLRLMPGDATHYLVLHDDVLVCVDFQRSVKAVLTANPHHPISLFGTRKTATQCQENGVHWYKQAHALMGQAVVWPSHLVAEFLWWSANCFKRVKPNRPVYEDDYIAAYSMFKHPMWYTAPSLVEHIGYDVSEIGISAAPGGKPRVAKWFIGASNTGIDIDWSLGVNDPPEDKSGPWDEFRSQLVDCDE